MRAALFDRVARLYLHLHVGRREPVMSGDVDGHVAAVPPAVDVCPGEVLECLGSALLTARPMLSLVIWRCTTPVIFGPVEVLPPEVEVVFVVPPTVKFDDFEPLATLPMIPRMTNTRMVVRIQCRRNQFRFFGAAEASERGGAAGPDVPVGLDVAVGCPAPHLEQNSEWSGISVPHFVQTLRASLGAADLSAHVAARIVSRAERPRDVFPPARAVMWLSGWLQSRCINLDVAVGVASGLAAAAVGVALAYRWDVRRRSVAAVARAEIIQRRDLQPPIAFGPSDNERIQRVLDKTDERVRSCEEDLRGLATERRRYRGDLRALANELDGTWQAYHLLVLALHPAPRPSAAAGRSTRRAHLRR